MEHSSHLHPEFGLLSPTPRLRRELRIAAISLLFGGIAGALCVSGVVALRHSDRAATEIAEGPHATASQEAASQAIERGSGPSADARAVSPERSAGTAPRPQASADVPAQSSETSAPASAIAPQPRMVRIRKAVDSPAIARLPLGRSEAPAAASPPADTPEFDASFERRPRRQRRPGGRAGESWRPPGRQRGRRQFIAAEEEGAKDGSHCQLSARRHRERFLLAWRADR